METREKVVVYSLGQSAQLRLPGCYGIEVVITGVMLDLAGDTTYRVEWFDEEIKREWVSYQFLSEVEETTLIEMVPISHTRHVVE
ncbi:hypothetical protein KOR42_23200 [Thalassoglobus neptunius]|uniref:Uncharacterized protein n=1 Tax=Thalassoglobus neptunius TaxID=1938619 RepID=A0A5C5X9E5_9PLAN|nr:hypothetical protein [Thalassoglobus neptunius]TWT58933.1 hypothetical protein KOR42_23200 [Thalassoglobus neptunius]